MFLCSISTTAVVDSMAALYTSTFLPSAVVGSSCFRLFVCNLAAMIPFSLSRFQCRFPPFGVRFGGMVCLYCFFVSCLSVIVFGWLDFVVNS